MNDHRPTLTPWGCPAPGPATEPDVAFHRGRLVFHSLSTDDPNVLRSLAAAAGRGEDLAAWATARLVHGVNCTYGRPAEA